jgi:condensin complex subunit 2
LLKDFSSISLKKFDLDFTVDPLFKKTSADFDEGGARGLLLNHLGIDRHCKIIFDASDATVDCDMEDLDGQTVTIDHIETHQESEPEQEDASSDSSDTDDDPMEQDDQEVIDTQVGNLVAEIAPEGTKEGSPIAEAPTKEEALKEESRVEIFRLKCMYILFILIKVTHL